MQAILVQCQEAAFDGAQFERVDFNSVFFVENGITKLSRWKEKKLILISFSVGKYLKIVQTFSINKIF